MIVIGTVNTSAIAAPGTLKNTISFTPWFNPIVSSTKVFTGTKITANIGTDGSFSQELAANTYVVNIPDTKSFYIEVTESSDTANILTLITSTLPSGADYTWDPSEALLPATTTTLGGVYLDRANSTTVALSLDGYGRPWLNGFYLYNPATGQYRFAQLFSDGDNVGLTFSTTEYDLPAS